MDGYNAFRGLVATGEGGKRMIEREYTEYKLTCDMCLLELSFDTWPEAADAAKDLDWKTKRDDDGRTWEHFCPDCKGDC